jgi:Fur family ferric uptake transcriptional regulator
LNSESEWVDRLQNYLSKNGLRLTNQRKLIAETFFETEGHLNFEQLYEAVRTRDGNVGQATVYRTLKVLVDSGLASSSRFGGNSALYESAITDDHHDHLICTECGLIIEFCDDEIESRQHVVAKNNGFAIKDHTMELYGECQRTNPQCPKR